jgi:ApbE superfamily uncharacterized protein (UPF0280 family)
MSGAARALLPGNRLHLQHGPIDLVIEAWGDPQEVALAYEQASRRFDDILATLVSELALLRAPLGEPYPLARGPVARRMIAACWPHRAVFLTPMAAVAGAVADEMLAALLAGRSLAKACVNDGGDIALHVSEGHSLQAGIADDPQRPRLAADVRIDPASPVRGIATSGWRGRSQSLGIADAVTILARTAAAADAAATLVANAVDIQHPSIRRLPARAVKHDSDLGDRLVTVAVEKLPAGAIASALSSGTAAAAAMLDAGWIEAAYLALQGQTRVVARTTTEWRLSA